MEDFHGLFIEYRDVHGKADETEARDCAKRDIFEGLQADWDLFEEKEYPNEKKLSLQSQFCGKCPLPQGIQEALNSGDGSYTP